MWENPAGGGAKFFPLPTGTLRPKIQSSEFESYSKSYAPDQFHFCMLCSFITTEKLKLEYVVRGGAG